MTQQTTAADLIAPHIAVIGDQPLTSGVSVVSATTAEGTTITSTTRFVGEQVESYSSLNDGVVTTPEQGAKVAETLTAAFMDLATVL